MEEIKSKFPQIQISVKRKTQLILKKIQKWKRMYFLTLRSIVIEYIKDKT